MLFFGKDEEKQTEFEEVHLLDTEKGTITEIQQGKLIPNKRSSHAMTTTRDGKTGYILGGANSNGPRKDLFKVDLETGEFT